MLCGSAPNVSASYYIVLTSRAGAAVGQLAIRVEPRSPTLRWTAVAMFWIAWGLLLFTRRETLSFPMFEDQMPIWNEADYLYRSNFDYEGLRYDEPHGDIGGARAIMTVQPTLIALIETTGLSIPATITLYRVFVFGCGALLFASVFELTRGWLGFPIAIAATSWVATTPLIRAQAEFPGTEIPMAAFLFLSTCLFVKRRLVLGAVSLLLAYALKPTALVGAVASFGGFGLLWALGKWRGRADDVVWFRRGLLVVGSLVGMEVAYLAWASTVEVRLDAPSGITHLLAIFCTPDVLAFLGVYAAMLVIAILGWRRCFRWTPSPNAIPEACQKAVLEFLLLSACTIGLLVTAILRLPYHPRYLTAIVPYLYTSIVVLSAWLSIPKTAIVSALAALSIFNLANANARFFPALPDRIGATPTYLERSLEYRPFLRSHWEAFKTAEAWNERVPVLITETFFHPAVRPGVGYSKEPLWGYSTMNVEAPTIRNVLKILEDKPPKLVVIALNDMFRVDDVFEFPSPTVPPDKILFTDGREVPLIVYLKTFNSQDTDEYEQWFVSLFTRSNVGGSVGWLLENDRPDLARRYLDDVLRDEPTHELARQLSEQLSGSPDANR